MKHILMFIIIALVSPSVFAAAWHEVGKVTRIHTGHGDGVMYFTTETLVSVGTCPTNTGGYTFSDSATNSERIYSLLLAAYVSKNPVTIYLNDTCLNGRPAVNAVQFKDQGVTP